MLRVANGSLLKELRTRSTGGRSVLVFILSAVNAVFTNTNLVDLILTFGAHNKTEIVFYFFRYPCFSVFVYTSRAYFWTCLHYGFVYTLIQGYFVNTLQLHNQK